MGTSDLEGLVDRLPGLVNGDAWLVERGRFLTADWVLGVGAVPYHAVTEHGRLVSIVRGPFLMRSWRFAVWASEDAWRRFWQKVPEPGFHDLFAIAKRGDGRFEGDLQPFIANLRYFKDVLASPRHAEGR